MPRSKPEVDSFRLRYGPYRPPKVRRGDTLFCELRGTVTVGGYSDAPIPWPRVKKGGGACLILCGSLVQAVKKEAVLAVAHHWGVSQTTVWKWRRALGVERWNDGSTQLMREWEAGRDDDRLARARANSKKPQAIAKVAATMQAKPLSPALRKAAAKAAKRPRSAAWCAAISRAMTANGHRPTPPPLQRPWTAAEDALLGTDRDAAVGKRIGRSRTAVCLRRLKLGVPGPYVVLDGRAIERLREAKGWTRRELADRAAVARQEVWRIETGKRRRTTGGLLARLLVALGVGLSVATTMAGPTPRTQVPTAR